MYCIVSIGVGIGIQGDTHLLAVLLVLYTNHLVPLLDHLVDLCLLEDLDAVRLVLGQILELPASAKMSPVVKMIDSPSPSRHT